MIMKGITLMTQDQVKSLCKWSVENSKRKLSDIEKEMIKQAIEESKTIEDLFMVAISIAMIDK